MTTTPTEVDDDFETVDLLRQVPPAVAYAALAGIVSAEERKFLNFTLRGWQYKATA